MVRYTSTGLVIEIETQRPAETHLAYMQAITNLMQHLDGEYRTTDSPAVFHLMDLLQNLLPAEEQLKGKVVY